MTTGGGSQLLWPTPIGLHRYPDALVLRAARARTDRAGLGVRHLCARACDAGALGRAEDHGARCVAAVDRGAAVVLDVRTPRERASGTIPGALAGSWREPAVGDPDAPVLVVCSHGARALKAVRALRVEGVDARSISGGMRAYRRDELPIERRS